MTRVFQKLYRISGSFVCVLSLIFTAFLFLSSFLSTCYAEDMTTQEVLTRWDNPLVNLVGTAFFLLALLFIANRICKKPTHRLPVLLLLVLFWCVFCGVVLVIFSKTVPAADAMSVYAIAGSLANGDTSVIHPVDSYLSYYPQQIGLVAFHEPLIRLWNLMPTDYPAYHFIKCVYILLVCVIILCQYRTVHLLWQDEKTDRVYLLLVGTNLPLILYSSFVYGEIPSFAAFCAGCLLLFKLLREDTGRRQQLLYAAGSILFLTWSVLLRKNSLILMIAVLIVILLESLSSGRKKLLLLALLCALGSLSILPITQSYYEHRADNKLSSGVTALSYFAMGMQEASRGNGWYNGFNFETYQTSGMDSALANDISRAAIRERLDYFGEHPGYAASFYLHKYLSQWADGTYASRQATLATFGGRVKFFQEVYEGSYSKFFIGYCNLYQNVLYLGAFVFCLSSFLDRRKLPKDPDAPPGLYVMLGLIGVFGGFLFHMIWEANGRYIFIYGLLLLPYAARGISNLRPPAKRKETDHERL